MISNRIVQKNRVAAGGNNNLWGWGDNTALKLIKGSGASFSSPVMSDKYGTGGYSWNMVSSGKEFVCAIDTFSKLWCWGKNQYGQLGDGTTNDSNSPVKIGNLNWNKVYCGTDHVMALNSSNKLFTWGKNDKGQLGDGTTTNKSSPVQIGSDGWIKLSPGHKFSTGIKYYTAYKGRLYTWGYNNSGQLGDGTTTDRLSPIKITYGSYPDYMWDNITAGYAHCLATANNYLSSKFLAWGLNNSGQLGNGNTTDYSSPTLVNSPSGSKIKILEAGGISSAIIDYGNQLYTFGGNAYGQLGNNQTTFSPVPIFVFYGSTYVQMIAKTKGKVTTFVKTGDATSGKLYSWGYGAAGILGNGSVSDISSPVQIGTDSDWIKLLNTGGIGGITMFAIKY